jgi:hypothetical protein
LTQNISIKRDFIGRSRGIPHLAKTSQIRDHVPIHFRSGLVGLFSRMATISDSEPFFDVCFGV